MKIIEFTEKYKNQVIQLILNIQNKEAGINLTLNEQPDLNDIQKSYMMQGGNFWIAINEKDEVIGTIGIINKTNGYAVLKKFFVHSDYRKKKVGFQLYQILLKFCRNNHIKVIILDTSSVATASHKFYEQNGFAKISKEDLPIFYEFPDRNSILYIKTI